VLTHIIQGCKR